MSPLPRAYFNRPTLEVATSLLGKYLVRETGSSLFAGMIAEVEAYIGPEDLACHASKGRTKRTEVLFGPPGTAYVYLIYGMYHCLNVVTERKGFPAAVLIRAIEPDRSSAIQPEESRGRVSALIDGPGRVCRSFHIDLELNRWDLTRGERLWLEDRGQKVHPSHFTASPRIGVDYAGEWAAKPWRFRLNQYVSRIDRRINRTRRLKIR